MEAKAVFIHVAPSIAKILLVTSSPTGEIICATVLLRVNAKAVFAIVALSVVNPW